MIEKSLARSSRHIRCTEEFIGLLEEDTGIRAFYLRAFLGCPSVPVKQALKVTFWAHDKHPGDPERAGEMVRAYCRKHGIGSYDRRLADAPAETFEASEHERSLGLHG